VGRHGVSERGRLMAAVLACSPEARAGGRSSSLAGVIVSHRSAAFLLELFEPLPRVIDVIRSDQRARKIDGIRPHFVAYPAGDERQMVAGIPCTSVPRTLVDLAGVLREQSLREAVERAATMRKLDIAAVEAILGRGRRRGAKRLRAILEGWRPVEELARRSKLRSLFEARLLPLLAAENVPLPQVNARVGVAGKALEVDLLWPEPRLVVEADSRRHHGIEVAFERDRKRDRELLDAGYTVIRVTWRQTEREPNEIAASIRGFLER
jgi:very-short-patch-repair endonuclease